MQGTQPIEIFRAGTHTAMSGQELAFAESDVAATAAAYDASVYEAPLVVGHPKTEDPAYGWVGALEAKGGKLLASPRQVDPQFAELVAAGRFKRVSASFWAPGSKGNPKPGAYYLRHVGFLGAAAPAVKGLKPVQFAAPGDEDLVTVEFAMGQWPWGLGSAARLFRGLRELVIEKFGQDAADKTIPGWEVDELARLAGSAQAEAAPSAFSEGDPENVKTKEQELAEREQALARGEADLRGREAALETREDAVAAKTAEFAEAARRRRQAEDEALVEKLIGEGKVLPSEKASLVAFMAALDGETAIEFAEGETKVRRTPREAFRAQLEARPRRVDFAERSAEDGAEAIDFADPDAIGKAAEAHQKKVKAETGEEISIAAAVQHVMKRKGA
jgi:hypothetical protein